MSDNLLDRIPNHDRVSILAVLVKDGDDPSQALLDAGILDAVAVPVAFGEDHPGAGFGDGVTPDLMAVLEPGPEEADPEAGSGGSGRGAAASRSSDDDVRPDSVTLPAAYGLRPLAPVRRIDTTGSARSAAGVRGLAGPPAVSPRDPAPTKGFRQSHGVPIPMLAQAWQLASVARTESGAAHDLPFVQANPRD